MLSQLSEFCGFCFQEYRISLYSLHFQGEFSCFSEGFYLCFVGLSRSQVQIRCAESICQQRRALIPAAVASLPADELFAGVRSSVLIQITSSCDIMVKSQYSVIFSGLLTEKSDLQSWPCARCW